MAKEAREKAKPLREKPDYPAHLVEPSAFEKLPREIRQQIYFYVGRLPVAKRMLVTYPHTDKSHNRVVLMKDALFRPYFRNLLGTKAAFWRFFKVHYHDEQGKWGMTHIEICSLLAVSKSIRCELLHLLLDAGVSVDIANDKPCLQEYLFGNASIEQIREVRSVATISYVASFTLECDGGDDTNLLRKNLKFIAQHAVNLREMTLEVYSALSPSDWRDWRVNLNRVIRSLHGFVRATSSERFDSLGIRKGASTEQQILRKKDFHKTCAWAVAVIQQKPNRSEIMKVRDIDISSIEEHDNRHDRHVFCAELPWWYHRALLNLPSYVRTT